MKTFIGTLISALLVLQFGCHDQSVSPPGGGGTPGTLHLQFSNSPAGIVQVVARLTRQGYDDRILALSISDSGGSASGTLNDIAAGTWHLKVDAIDDQGHIKYSGETNVEVIGGQTTQVSLQLNPTTGSLEITVTWGQVCTPAPAGLVSWWKAEHNTSDAIGENNGTFVNSPVFSQGKVESAFEFNGVNSYVRVPHSASLNTSGSLTIEGWIYPTKDTLAMILCKWGWRDGWENQRAYSLNLWPGRNLNFGIADDANQWSLDFQGFQTHGGVLAINSWNHIAAVYDKASGERRLYVNGLQVATRTDAPITITQSIADVSIGAYLESPSGVTSFFPGKIDEMSFYDKALSGTEIKSIYDAGNIGKCTPLCIPVPSGLVSWWRGDGNSNDAADGNNGELMNGAGFASGKVGDAFIFDGVDDYVRVPSSANLNPTGSFSIDAWIYPTQDVDAGIALKWGDTGEWDGQRALQVSMVSGGKLRFAISDSAHQADPAFHVFDTDADVLTINGWNHIAAVYNQPLGKRQIYVNGTKVAERTDMPIHVMQSTADFSIGCALRSPTYVSGPFPGSIDEVDFYNKALTESEIRSIYLAGNVGKCPPQEPQCASVPSGIISWWQGDGSAGDATDGNNGILMNGSAFASGKVGQAFSFDGIDDFVRIPNSANLNPTGSFSIDAWIYPTQAVLGVIVYKWGDEQDWVDQRSYALEYHADGGIGFAISDSAHQHDLPFHVFHTSAGLATLNTWSHIAAVYDKNSGARRIYVNGVKAAERIDPPIAVWNGIADVSIGTKLISSSTFGYEFAGRIDEVDFFSKALTDSEIHSIFAAGNTGKCK
jgi:hypothetical protein